MSGDQAAGVVAVLLMLTLVGSGLIARRLPARRTLAMAAIWVGLFGLALLLARAVA